MTSDVTVNYTVSAGTADGTDVDLSSGSVVITAGTDFVYFSPTIYDDSNPEPTENFYVQITSVSSGYINDADATGTIYDDDGGGNTPPEFDSDGDPDINDPDEYAFTITVGDTGNVGTIVAYDVDLDPITYSADSQQFPAFKKRRGFRGRLLEAFVTREARLVFTHKGNPGIITSS